MTTEIEQAAANQTLASLLAFDIIERRKQDLRKKISSYPRTVSILSDIGECDRQMTYHITNWKDRPLHDEDLQARFDAGKLQESELMRELEGLRYDVQAGQEVVEIKNRAGETIARGKIDGKIKYQGIKIPFEIKSMNPMVFDNIDTIDDFRKKPYLRKYLRQIQMYLYGNNVEEGLLLCTDCLGHWKVFVVTLDYGEAEQILQRLERVHSAVKIQLLPDRIEYRDEICGKCAFAHICLPDILRKESEIITDDEFIERLERRAQVSAARSEYERLDKSIKADVKKRVTKQAIAGDFFIKIGTPIAVAEKVVAAYSFSKISIERMGEIEKPKAKE